MRWKILLFALCLTPLALLAWDAFHGGLGANPIEYITHATGDWTLRFLAITLFITPLRQILQRPQLIRYRRMLGLFAFFYGCLHFLTWLWLDKFFDWNEMVADVVKRRFITVGFAAFILMLPLAVTSTAGWIRRLGGKRWQMLHRLIYLSAIGGVVHYYWLVKSDVRKPLMYGAIVGAAAGVSHRVPHRPPETGTGPPANGCCARVEELRIAVIGEILWDVFGEAEHLGGAPFNFAAHAARLGHDVRFASAVGRDDRGERALARMAELGLSAGFVRRVSGRPTGTVTVRIHGAGQPEFTIHRPAAYDSVELTANDLASMAAFRPDWIYFGSLHQVDAGAREATRRLIEAVPAAGRFYDVNLRPHSYTPELVRDLMRRATVVKLNEHEVAATGWSGGTLEAFCRSCTAEFEWQAVCVTRGECGSAALVNGVYTEAPGYPIEVADTVGAGDAFAAAFLHGLAEGWLAARIADFANRVGALVASRAGGVPPWTPEEARAGVR